MNVTTQTTTTETMTVTLNDGTQHTIDSTDLPSYAPGYPASEHHDDNDGAVVIRYASDDPYSAQYLYDELVMTADKYDGTMPVVVLWHSQRECDAQSRIIADPSTPAYDAAVAGRLRVIEEYDHGLIVYALQNESSSTDCRWDVTPHAGVILLPSDVAPEKVDDYARGYLAELTDIENGDIYSITELTLRPGHEPNIDVTYGYTSRAVKQQFPKRK